MGKNTYKIPKDKEAETLTYEQNVTIIENQPEPKKKGRRFAKKK